MPSSTSTSTPRSESAPSASSASKRDFILAQPPSMPVRDVVTEAREAGLQISESYVYNLRTQIASAATPPLAKGKRGRPPGSKNKSTNASGALSASPSGKPAMATLPARLSREAVPRSVMPAGSASTAQSSNSEETSFRKLVVQLGVTRADELVADVRQRLDRLVAGE